MVRIRAKTRRVTGRDIDAVVRFSAILQSIPGGEVARWAERVEKDDGTLTISPDPDYHPQVVALIKDLYKHGLVQPFDWPSWQKNAKAFVDNPTLLQKADLQSCIKLITTHVRKDRFCGGHFGAMVTRGHIAAVLRRLAHLREERPAGAPKSQGAR